MNPRVKPASCSGCSCFSHGSDFSQVEGTGSSGVLLVGEASGEHEQRDQLPFRPYAPAGGVLTRVLQRMGLRRDMFSITNCIRCRPRHNFLDGAPWEYAALRQCRSNLDAAIAQYRPRCIVALGGIALRELTGLAGEKLGITYLAGYPLPLEGGASAKSAQPGTISASSPTAEHVIPVVGDFHPSYLRRGKASHQGVFARVIQRALNIAQGKDRMWTWQVDPGDARTWNGLDYYLHPSVGAFADFRDYILRNPGLRIAKDIETPESASMDEDAREGFKDTEIRQIQFCVNKTQAMAVPWRSPFKEIAIDILHAPNVSYGHNWMAYDHKVLRAAAAREGWRYAPTGPVYDTLDMFHQWQPDLPAHLQFASQWISFPFPWKHLHTLEHEPFYGCCDVDSDWQLGEFLVATLKRDGLWEGYIHQVYEVRPVLAAMEDRGMPIDDAARVRLGTEFEIAQGQLGVALSGMAPQECQRVHPKDGYKGVPPEVKKYCTDNLVDDHYAQDVIATLRWQDWPHKDDHGELRNAKGELVVDGDEGEWYHYEQRTFTESKAVLDGSAGEPSIYNTEHERWCRIYDFNPNSQPQVIAYMKAKGHPVPKDKQREDDEGQQPDTTKAKELLRLAAKTGDVFYIKVVEYRGYTKLRGTYVDGFRPGADGRVHPTFTFDTGIGQLSARNPNTQNFVKLKPTPELARAMRAMVCADPGYMLTEIDFKSCHVITLGYLAGDANYTRLGRLDIHSAVAGHFLNLWDIREILKETDEQLLARFKWLKSNPEWKLVRDDQAKHGILGIGNGLRAKGLYERYMEQFPPRQCPECHGVGRVKGLRGMKQCPECHATGLQPGMRIAECILDICEDVFAPVFAFQEEQRREAHERQQLRTEFGHMRRFYEVLRPDPRRGGLVHGDQAEEAVAYRLANVAHAHMREVMKAIDQRGMAERYGMFNQIHDALQFHHPQEMAGEVIAEVMPIMTAESTVYRGLWMGAEASQGVRWSEMKEVGAPKVMAAAVGGGHNDTICLAERRVR